MSEHASTNRAESAGRLRFQLFYFGLLLVGCTGVPSSLNPHGPAAAQIASLGWVMVGVGTAVWLVVTALLLLALFRRRPGEPKRALAEKDLLPGAANTWIVGGGVVIPAVILVGLIALTVGTLRAIPQATSSDEASIEVIGHQWWWEVRYPDRQVTTANEIHIPVGQPIALKLTSDDVIHSLWVPELHGKFDLIPGQTNALILQADQPGEYRGQCAEFCGIQHAKMGLIVMAESPEAFAAWLDGQAQPASAPTDPLALKGQQIFLGSGCAACHTIRGANADGKIGPDLTHLASRSMLAAATTTNTREHLAEWIMDPQKVKPGNLMPKSNLDAGELQALLAYLESLK